MCLDSEFPHSCSCSGKMPSLERSIFIHLHACVDFFFIFINVYRQIADINADWFVFYRALVDHVHSETIIIIMISTFSYT